MKKIITTFLLAASFTCFAEIVPTGAPQDSRVQTVTYDPNNVTNVYTMVGRTTLIQLEDDERIVGESSGLSVGDSEAWSIGVRGNNIMLKPAGVLPTTNMTIVTDKRTYLFSLLTANRTNNSHTNRPPTYILRFEYPDTKERLELERLEDERIAAEASEAAIRALAPKPGHNINYWMWGDTVLAPTYAWDDGRFTYFRYPNSKDLPVVFKLLPSGKEATVNIHIEGDTIVVHETANKFYLRFGDSVLGIENQGHDPEGQFNYRGTTVDGTVRVENGGQL